MNRWHALLSNWAISIMLALIVAINLVSSYYELYFISNAVILGLIPALLIIYFDKQKLMATIFCAILILYFVGLICSVPINFELSSKLSESSFIGAYALMVFVMIGKLKHVKFEGVVSWYLIIVLLINTYLMYAMFVNVQDSFNDSVNLTLSVSKGVLLLVMGFLAFAIYLSKETSQTILFLTIVCCFVFADVLSFTNSLYVQFWLFEGFQKTLQGLGLFLLYVYIFNHQESVKGIVITESAESITESNQLPV
ncbi:hypothetical protein [Gelidibacter salicanalis]|uniref:Uncharacterized protein n=1 Tax=Gelidibacter salicanalis TaxID=291193 RepID=A0A934NDH0_9FLAO|nr:hypothetical protein [Gelidibacter salicanalis]MBJ7881700.1 hypothetical protein [Gelidibacter salicanalis]